MARPKTKAELLDAAKTNYEKLNTLIDSLTEEELSTPFDFSGAKNKKEAHWKRDKNLRDVLVHLYEWHRLMTGWVKANKNGGARSFLPAEYTWRTYGTMNVELWRKHQNTSLEEAKELLENSHQEVMELLDTFSNEELFSKGVYPWVGTSNLGSYFISTTSSHYDWAVKKLKAHRKVLSERKKECTM